MSQRVDCAKLAGHYQSYETTMKNPNALLLMATLAVAAISTSAYADSRRKNVMVILPQWAGANCATISAQGWGDKTMHFSNTHQPASSGLHLPVGTGITVKAGHWRNGNCNADVVWNKWTRVSDQGWDNFWLDIGQL